MEPVSSNFYRCCVDVELDFDRMLELFNASLVQILALLEKRKKKIKIKIKRKKEREREKLLDLNRLETDRTVKRSDGSGSDRYKTEKVVQSNPRKKAKIRKKSASDVSVDDFLPEQQDRRKSSSAGASVVNVVVVVDVIVVVVVAVDGVHFNSTFSNFKLSS